MTNALIFSNLYQKVYLKFILQLLFESNNPPASFGTILIQKGTKMMCANYSNLHTSLIINALNRNL